MAEVLTGTLRGRTIVLDTEQPGLTAREGRVRVAVEPLGGARSESGSAQLLDTWAARGPHGPIEGSGATEAPEDPDLVIADDEQLRLLRDWTEQGPQGPIDG